MRYNRQLICRANKGNNKTIELRTIIMNYVTCCFRNLSLFVPIIQDHISIVTKHDIASFMLASKFSNVSAVNDRQLITQETLLYNIKY